MTKYTVTNRDGDIEGRGLSLEDAAHTVLTYDGYGYEVRQSEDGEGFWLWATPSSRNAFGGAGLMTKSMIYSGEPEITNALAEIWHKVILQCGSWPHQMEVMTDEAYDKMMADAVASEQE